MERAWTLTTKAKDKAKDKAEAGGQAAAALFDEAVAAAAAQAPADGDGPAVIEGGRYKVFQAPDGGWVIARAVDTCERCRECGCGDQAEPVQIPAMVIQLARAQGAGLLGKLKAMRKANGDGG